MRRSALCLLIALGWAGTEPAPWDGALLRAGSFLTVCLFFSPWVYTRPFVLVSCETTLASGPTTCVCLPLPPGPECLPWGLCPLYLSVFAPVHIQGDAQAPADVMAALGATLTHQYGNP